MFLGIMLEIPPKDIRYMTVVWFSFVSITYFNSSHFLKAMFLLSDMKSFW